MSDGEKKPEQKYRIITPAKEKIWTVPGNRGSDDMRIYSEFPKQPWATTLYYVGCVLRLKGFVEDRNYSSGYGHGMLAAFIMECICHPEIPIKKLCSKYRIPNGKDEHPSGNKHSDIPIENGKSNLDLTEAVNSFWKEQGW